MRIQSLLLKIILAIPLLWAPLKSQASIRIGGGAAPINNIFRKVQKSFTASTGIQLILSEDGPDSALQALDEGKLDIASAGLGPKDWLELMAKKI